MCPIGSYCVFPVYAATENLGYVDIFSLWQQLSLEYQQNSSCLQSICLYTKRYKINTVKGTGDAHVQHSINLKQKIKYIKWALGMSLLNVAFKGLLTSIWFNYIYMYSVYLNGKG